MSKTITRREILQLTGGGILGMMLSPLPWKLLDDSAIWTQNWSLTPKLSHGPITTAFSHCTLCNGGCAIKAQSISGMPYYLTGVQNHPETHGTLCARGLAGHHMAHHPLRIVHPHKFVGKTDNSTMVAVSLQESLERITAHIKNQNGTVAILDQQPNRALSGIYREFLQQISNGKYLTAPGREDSTIIALEEMLHINSDTLGFDFENTKLILSFGAPLLDNWGNPGRMTAVRNSKQATFIQVDSRYSRTAMQSDQWFAIKPGSEKIFALSIANVLLFEHIIPLNVQRSAVDLDHFKNVVKEFTPELSFDKTGIDPLVVRSIAQQLITAESAIVLSSADPGGGPFDVETEKIIAALNLLIGGVGKSGGIVTRHEIPGYKNSYHHTLWSEIPDNSISLLIVDGAESGYALPWNLIERKLNIHDNLVVSFSPVLNEISSHSDYLIPSPAHYETMRDVPTTIGNRISTFAIATPLIKKKDFTTEPLEVILEIAKRLSLTIDIPTNEELILQKVAAIYAREKGSVYMYADQSTIMVSDLSSADELFAKLTEGAIWIDGPKKQQWPKTFLFNVTLTTPKVAKENGIPLIAYGWRGTTSASQISPILSKIFQETELRNCNGIVSINPATAKQFGLVKNESANLSTKNGSMMVRIKIDATVRPDVIEASIGPLPNGSETPMNPRGATILNLCEVTTNGTWRITNATLSKV